MMWNIKGSAIPVLAPWKKRPISKMANVGDKKSITKPTRKKALAARNKVLNENRFKR